MARSSRHISTARAVRWSNEDGAMCLRFDVDGPEGLWLTVRMRGDRIRGGFDDGDPVWIRRPWRQGGSVEARWAFNLSTNSYVRVVRRRAGVLALLGYLVAVAAFAALLLRAWQLIAGF